MMWAANIYEIQDIFPPVFQSPRDFCNICSSGAYLNGLHVKHEHYFIQKNTKSKVKVVQNWQPFTQNVRHVGSTSCKRTVDLLSHYVVIRNIVHYDDIQYILK